MSETTNWTDLAKEYLWLRAEKFKREGELSAIKQRYKQIELEIIAFFEAEKGTSRDYDKRLLYESVYASPAIIPGKDLAYFSWLDEHGEGGIAKRQIHNKTLPSWYNKTIIGNLKKRIPPTHPEWEEELARFLNVYEQKHIHVRGDDDKVQRAIAEEQFRKEHNWNLPMEFDFGFEDNNDPDSM